MPWATYSVLRMSTSALNVLRAVEGGWKRQATVPTFADGARSTSRETATDRKLSRLWRMRYSRPEYAPPALLARNYLRIKIPTGDKLTQAVEGLEELADLLFETPACIFGRIPWRTRSERKRRVPNLQRTRMTACRTQVRRCQKRRTWTMNGLLQKLLQAGATLLWPPLPNSRISFGENGNHI